ncbi:protein of unknown function [Candidatus Promineifilum breve]|uniref:Uncharacterized protein n=1 Tax=Candidatus Promineifilum breve TaxID=1806508 RepID=A0A160SYZ0_9CHLR|nr:protein of unknown function [Candidatus Promineifilum breve]
MLANRDAPCQKLNSLTRRPDDTLDGQKSPNWGTLSYVNTMLFSHPSRPSLPQPGRPGHEPARLRAPSRP